MSRIAKIKELVSIESVIQHFGGRFSHRGRRGELWFFDGDEKKASIEVNEETGKIHNFRKTNGKDAHGDILDYWKENMGMLRNDKEDHLKAMSQMEEFAAMPKPISIVPLHQEEPKGPKDYSDVFKIVSFNKKKIQAQILLDDLARRCISPRTAFAKGLKEVKISYFSKKLQKEKEGYAFAFENDAGGYAVTIPNPWKPKEPLKTNIGPAGITSIPGKGDQPDHIVLNGVGNSLQAASQMKKRPKPTYGHESVFDYIVFFEANIPVWNYAEPTFIDFLDDDDAGRRAMQGIMDELEDFGFRTAPGLEFYAGKKDLSQGWRDQREGVSSVVRKHAQSKKNEIKYSRSDAAEVLRDRSPYGPKPRH